MGWTRVAGDAGLGATRLCRFEAVARMAGVAFGRHGMALHAGLHLGLGLVGEVLGVRRPLHGEHMAGEAVAGLVLEVAVLLSMAGPADLGGGQVQALVVGPVTVRAGNRVLILEVGMAARTPVGDDPGGDGLVALDALAGGKDPLHALDGLEKAPRVPPALHRVGRPGP